MHVHKNIVTNYSLQGKQLYNVMTNMLITQNKLTLCKPFHLSNDAQSKLAPPRVIANSFKYVHNGTNRPFKQTNSFYRLILVPPLQ